MTETIRVHACSLSTSALPRIEKSIEEEKDHDNELRLRWLKVAMKYNIQTQLQFLYKHLGSKEKDPKFRPIKMASFWRQWKRQAKRDDWQNIQEDLRHKISLNQIHYNKIQLDRQRSEIAARNFVKNPLAQFCPLDSLFSQDAAKYLYSYQSSASCRPGYFNRGIEFLASSAVRTISEAPTTTADE